MLKIHENNYITLCTRRTNSFIRYLVHRLLKDSNKRIIYNLATDNPFIHIDSLQFFASIVYR